MPEGDTVHKVAAVLQRELCGRRLECVELDGRPFPIVVGREVEEVAALGKHFLVGLDGGLTLRVHLGLHGSWHRYPKGEAWRRPRRQASVVLGTAEQVLVCFNAMEVECLPTDGLRRHPVLSRLGPDLLENEVNLDEVVARARRLAESAAPVADLLLDQRVAAGIGNVYKSEVLFLVRVHPATPVGELSDALLRRLYDEGRRLLRSNLRGGERITTTVEHPGSPDLPRLWVYGRGRRPCLRCGAAIRSRRLGRGLRSTYWCPRCQVREA